MKGMMKGGHTSDLGGRSVVAIEDRALPGEVEVARWGVSIEREDEDEDEEEDI
jgi:hypothetical protein